MKIATWNVNSLKVRLPHVLDWLAATQADVAYNWDTGAADVAAGEHTLALRVVDTSENAASASVRVTVTKWSAGK